MNLAKAKQHIIDRIQSIDEWPDNGTARLGLMQVAFDQGWYLPEFN